MHHDAIRRSLRPLRHLLPTAALLLLVPALAGAWSNDPNVNNPVCTATGNQNSPVSVSDGSGGMFVAWWDDRNLGVSGTDIYLTHLAKGGTLAPGWPVNGLAVCNAPDAQYFPVVAADGTGGVFVAWEDHRSGYWTVYAQHVTSGGALASGWSGNGLLVGSSGTKDNLDPRIVSDGTGGAFLTWTLIYTPSTDYDIYGSHVLGNGTIAPGWGATGRGLASPVGIQDASVPCSDGAGGVFVAYQDNGAGNFDLRLLHVNAAATLIGPVNVDNTGGDQVSPRILSDGSGGTYVMYQNVYGTASLARMDANMVHVTGWGALTLGTYGSGSANPVSLAPDGSTGVYACWTHYNFSYYDSYVVHVSGNGQYANGWALGGVYLNNSLGTAIVDGAALLADGSGGVIATYASVSGSLLAQRFLGNSANPTGWSSSGNTVSSAAGSSANPCVVPDGSGGELVAWTNNQSGSFHLYGDRIEHFGRLGDPEPVLAGVKDVPNDQGGHVRVNWLASYVDADPIYGIYNYVLFRQAPAAAVAVLLERGDAVTMTAEECAPGALAARATGAAPAQDPRRRFLAVPTGAQITYWEQVALVTSAGLPAYGYVAPTTADSIGGSNPRTLFMVEAVGNGQWFSAPDSGYSVDNLPPVAPAPFTGTFFKGTGTILAWSPNAEGDLAGYRLYKGYTPGFLPGPGNRIAQLSGTTNFTDGASSSGWYKLSAYDIHGNESGYTALLPGGTLAVGDGAPRSLAFALASANPVHGGAALHLSLPATTRVRVAIYDAAGRVVRVLVDAERTAGEWTVGWDGADELGRAAASGLYFARLDIPGRQVTQRLVVAR